jgi:hypothetical protein
MPLTMILKESLNAPPWPHPTNKQATNDDGYHFAALQNDVNYLTEQPKVEKAASQVNSDGKSTSTQLAL